METVVQSVWSKSKILIKGIVIGLLVLILLIPTLYVQNLIEEREARQRAAITEVSSKWAGKQVVTGPVLVLPYWKNTGDTSGKVSRVKHYAYFLSDELNIRATVTPLERYRGIYKVMLYNSKINLSGTFNELAFAKWNIPAKDIVWNEAAVHLNIEDTKGLNEELKLKWNDTLLDLAPQASGNQVAAGGLSAPLSVTGPEALKNIRFSSEINLNGSEQLLFTPTGKVTSVSLSSQWPHPSFTGDILPQTSTVKDSGFTAAWESLAHKRPFPQQWQDNAYTVSNLPDRVETVTASNNISQSAFGVDLFVPVNGYQKTMRSIKYAVLCILLTFAAFFIIETTNQRSVHPFQYALIGLALILFYTLLLSFSEYIGFNLSYVIASLCTIGLIGWFVKGILSSGKLSAILSLVLMLMYTYLFTILQLQDYSLLFGSIGLFLTLAVIMHFSKKIQW